MMKYCKFLLLFLSMGMLQGCPAPDDEILAGILLIKNDGNEDFYYYEDFSINTLNSADINFDRLKAQRLKVNNVKEANIYQYHFEKNQRLCLFIFKQSTLDNYTWEEIKRNNMYDELYVLTLKDLQQMNWEVVYNGN